MGRGRKLECDRDFERALKNKYGVGQGSEYKPWLRIQDVKSKGKRSLIFGRKVHREHHMMSSIESEHFNLAEFSNSVVDIREQFPLFPLNLTQKIAKIIGVEHPKHIKTKEPIIMTTDQLLTIQSPQGISYHAVSVKPEDDSDVIRTLEKQDIERVYWELQGVKFHFFTGNELTKVQSNNLDWATSPFRKNSIGFLSEQTDLALSTIDTGQCLVENICNRLISLNAASHDEALLLVRFLITNRLIEVDLSTNIPESGLIRVKSVAERTGGAIYGVS
ncbi:TnsA endonuclease N-terminal domain-containing protein [Veronia pacifica]|uniref:Transposase n=1 Tax=Veronia pacifica TaxID=1080227 RepID=A0A1C3ECA7_9GAMM|nr:TnsA endonuclease N-terminal domain-containing protein [Veronia pacifica]ODA30868.1 transposase [Veronia pacifica]